MAQVVEDHGGVVLEFIGDAIQCIYGAPLHNDCHPFSAVEDILGELGTGNWGGSSVAQHGGCPKHGRPNCQRFPQEKTPVLIEVEFW